MAGRKPPRAPRISVATDLRYAQGRSPFTKAGTDQFLTAAHLDDAGAEDKDSNAFQEVAGLPAVQRKPVHTAADPWSGRKSLGQSAAMARTESIVSASAASLSSR